MGDEHNLELQKLDYSIVQQCMHCGMCLPTCPTYDATLRERNSPRGRIAWMRRVADGELPLNADFAEEMSYCLGCMACTTACPAGVDYGHLLETARSDVASNLEHSATTRWLRWFLLDVLFRRPWYLRGVGRLIWIFQASGLRSLLRASGATKILPGYLQRLERQSPTVKTPFSAGRIQEVERPQDPKHRVVLLTGCVQDILYADVNRSTVDVLLAHGCEVITPRSQHCCGSLHAHNGELELARRHARQNIDSVDLENVDAIISNAGGCGSHLRHYGKLLADDAKYADRSLQWDAKLRDVHEFIAATGGPRFGELPGKENQDKQLVAYDESCHLKHSQGVSHHARDLLAAIPDIQLVPLTEADWCCGSAGIYSLTQPEQADELADRKVQHILASGAQVVATANPGCQLQLENALAKAGSSIQVCHTMQLAAAAIQQ